MTRRPPFRMLAAIIMSAGAAACATLLDIPSDRFYATDETFNAPESGVSDGDVDGAAADASRPCTQPIKVKRLADLTGPTSVYISAHYGFYDHIREINAAGGILGCKIEVEVRDYGYLSANALKVYDEWRAQPDWEDVAMIYGWSTPDALALGPRLREDRKPMSTGSYLGRFGTPEPISRQIAIPEVNAAFQENTTLYNFKSDGFPYTYFSLTDYSTSARIVMLHAKLLGAKRIGFVRCSDEFCRETALAAQEYVKRQGMQLGRTLLRELSSTSNGQPVPTGTRQSYEDGVYDYFVQEKQHSIEDPTYVPVDFLWVGNLANHTEWVANGLKRVQDDPSLGYHVQILANKQGFDESVLKCANCEERVHGVLIVPSYGDLRVPEMSRIMTIHDKWRDIDYQAALAAQADGGQSDSGGGDAAAPVLKAYRTQRYIQGYLSVNLLKVAAEKVIRAGKPVNGVNLKEALDSFQNVDSGGITRSINLSAKDHRPQATELFYKISGQQYVLEAERSVVLEEGWLGW